MENAVGTESIQTLTDGAARLIAFGPIGLAALMLILVIFALAMREMSAPRERLLKTFLYVGFGSLVLLVGAQFFSSSHIIRFRVEPHDIIAFQSLPRPVLTVNSTVLTAPFQYEVVGETIAIIDVSNAINVVQKANTQLAQQAKRVEVIKQVAETTQSKLDDYDVAADNLDVVGVVCPPSPDPAVALPCKPVGLEQTAADLRKRSQELRELLNKVTMTAASALDEVSVAPKP